MSTNQMFIDDGAVATTFNGKKYILVSVIVVIIIIIVGVLAGVLSGNREKEKCEQRIKEAVLAAKSNGSGVHFSSLPTSPYVSSTTRQASTPSYKPSWDKIRLPTELHPTHYDMLIRVYLNNLTFSGNSKISLTVTAPTDIIIFHVNSINILKVKVLTSTAKHLSISRHYSYVKRQFYVVHLARKMAQGIYELRLEFQGNIETKELNGLYKSTYKSSQGETRVLAVTDFQPTDARKAFPCFDEPAMKATFTISIEHRSDYTALSNMNAISSQSLSNGRIVTYFNKSVPMPTYLVGMIVSDFKSLNGTTKNNVTIKTWGTPVEYKDSAYALKIALNVTTFLENYYGVNYPLPKQDMVAVPDFNSGAMENWGLITYRESAFFYKEGVSSETNKQRIASVVAHELAHMWFGNLVSCRWWNDIWLNEGFASYVQYLAAHEAEPDWELLEQFLLRNVHRAFRFDALANSHPITVNVEDPEDIKTIFDIVTYSKGCTVIRMLSDFLSEETFREGLKIYLKKYKFGSATTQDLWDALSLTSGKNVTELMETWIEQMGFPVVSLRRDISGKGFADQKHFLNDPKAHVTEPSRFNYKWMIKLTYVTENDLNNTKFVWMKKSTAEFDWPDDEWIKANVGQYGFYRVNYDSKNWAKLTQVLKNNPEKLSSADRTSLVDDVLNLARAGQLGYDIALNLSSYIKNEDNYAPWKAFETNIDFIDTMMSTQDSYGKFQKYMLDILSHKKIKEVGWENVNKTDRHLEIYMRSLILSSACSYGHQESIENAKKLFLLFLHKNTSLDVNLKSLIYFYGIASTSSQEWAKLFEKYLTSIAASEKNKLLYGLSGSREPWVLRRFLRYSIDSSKIRDQDTVTVVRYVAQNALGRELAWKFLKENWNIFYSRYSKSSFRMATVITSTTSMMNSQVELDDVKEFFKGKDAGSGARAVKQTIERIQSNIDWIKRSAGFIGDYLNKLD